MSLCVCPVSSDKEISVVCNGIIVNPDSFEVHGAACFALMRLASSRFNVDFIRRNGTCRMSLELAFCSNQNKNGNNVLILLGRLGFDSPVAAEK